MLLTASTLWLSDLHDKKRSCLTAFHLCKKNNLVASTGEDDINPLSLSWWTSCCPDQIHTEVVVITRGTRAEGTVLVLVLLLAGWFLLLLSSLIPCWWPGGLAAPCSQSLVGRASPVQSSSADHPPARPFSSPDPSHISAPPGSAPPGEESDSKTFYQIRASATTIYQSVRLHGVF